MNLEPLSPFFATTMNDKVSRKSTPLKINMPPLTHAKPFPSPEISTSQLSLFPVNQLNDLSFSSSVTPNSDFVPNIRSPRMCYTAGKRKNNNAFNLDLDENERTFYRACAEMIDEKFPTTTPNHASSNCSEDKSDTFFFESKSPCHKNERPEKTKKMKGILEERSTSSSSSLSLSMMTFEKLHAWQQQKSQLRETSISHDCWDSYSYSFGSENLKQMDSDLNFMFMTEDIRYPPKSYPLDKTHTTSHRAVLHEDFFAKTNETPKKKSTPYMESIEDVLSRLNPSSRETSHMNTNTTTTTPLTTTMSTSTSFNTSTSPIDSTSATTTTTTGNTFFKDDSVSSFGSSRVFIDTTTLNDKVQSPKHTSPWEKIKKISPRLAAKLSPRLSPRISPKDRKKKKQKDLQDSGEEKLKFESFKSSEPSEKKSFSFHNEKVKKFKR